MQHSGSRLPPRLPPLPASSPKRIPRSPVE
jgi:hypothetical protein